MKTYCKPILILSILLLQLTGLAQTPTTQGTEFWVSYMKNGHRDSDDDRLTLFVSAKENSEVTVSNPRTNYQTTFLVAAGQVAMQTIPDEHAYNSQMSGVADKGLLVTATKDISLYIGNEASNSYDASNVLPANALGTSYMLQTNNSVGEASNHYQQNRASFLIVATVDNTVAQITPTAETFGDNPAGQPFTVTLNRGQVYHVMAKNGSDVGNTNGDLSGTTVMASYPVAVFNGNCLTAVPGGTTTGYDHVFEQAMPTDYWGQRFVVTSIKRPFNMQDLGPDLVKVTALNDHTSVKRDGNDLFLLDAGESGTFEMNLESQPCTYLEADNPVAVYVYNHSHAANGSSHGDPSMVWVSPVEQTIEDITFSTFQVQDVSIHYANIVCYSAFVDDVVLDGEDISSSFRPVPGNTDFSYTRFELYHGPHTLSCEGGFIAHVYGIGEAEGYAYSVGSSAKSLTKQLYVNDMLASGIYPACKDEALAFRVEANYDFHHVLWKFGDGQENTSGDEISHAYTAQGTYDFEAVLFRQENEPFDTLFLELQVYPTYSSQQSVTTCAATYPFAGEEYPVPGSYQVVLQSVHACDSVIGLVLELGNEIPYEIERVACESFEWFGETYTTSGRYEHRVPDVTPEGCDSLYVLQLTVGYPPDHPEWEYATCEPFWWGQWCEETRDYYKHLVTPEGCEYDSVLHFTLLDRVYHVTDTSTCGSFEWNGQHFVDPGHYQDTLYLGDCEFDLLDLVLTSGPAFSAIMGATEVAVSNSFWPGRYEYRLDDSTGVTTDSLHWELVDNTEWLLFPQGATCVVVPTTMDNVTLHAWSDEDPLCEKHVYLTIHGSGFGVGEEHADALKLFPNPARQELTIQGEEMTRILVYDQWGQRLLERPCDMENSVTIRLDGWSPGLYLAEVQTKKGNKTRLFAVIL